MKFIHIADIHLGMVPDEGKPWSAEREKEIWQTFVDALERCKEEKADLILIAGDLFHKQPLLRELKEVSYFFERLAPARVVLIAGNHDYIGARSNYIGFAWPDNVAMLMKEELERVFFEDINTEIYGFSYHARNVQEPRFQTVEPEFKSRFNLFIGHGGSPSYWPVDQKRLMNAGFDYIAMGHIHMQLDIGERMKYAGSLEPLDKNELGQHGYIRGELQKPDFIRTERVSFSVRQYIRIKVPVTPDVTNGGLLEILKLRIQEMGSHNIFRISLQGKRDVDMIFNQLPLYLLGNVVDVEDATRPDYDFEALRRENQDNIIGMYIDRIRQDTDNEKIAEKALYYGIEALQKAME